MVNEQKLTKFEKHIDSIKKILNEYLNSSVNSIQDLIQNIFKEYFNKNFNSAEVDKKNKPIKDVSKIKIVKTTQNQHSNGIESICLLKDKRLVSCGGYGDDLIIVYDREYRSQFKIEEAHFSGVFSLCVLRNGDLVSSGNEEIKVWRINENDYQFINSLTGHSDDVYKVIELKDGRICSCSSDKTIKIWDNYKCIQTLEKHTNAISVIEMNNFIIAASYDNTLRIWDESTYKTIQTIKGMKCWSSNGISKLNDDTVIVGDKNVIHFVDIKTYKSNKFKDESLGQIWCLNVSGDRLVLIGNYEGEIVCYDSSFNKIIFKNKFHDSYVSCIIESEDKLISSSKDNIINIYQ